MAKEIKVRELNKDNVSGYIATKMNELFSLKSGRYPRVNQFINEYKQNYDANSNNKDDSFNYSMNTGFALVNEKHSHILAVTPKYDFMPLDEDSKRYRRVAEMEWMNDWLKSKTDAALSMIVHDALLKGAGFGFEDIVCDKRVINVPKYGEDGAIEFEEVEEIVYEGPRLTYVPWENVFFNGRSLDEANEAIILEYLPRTEAIKRFSSSKLYSNVSEESIPKGKFYYVNSTNGVPTMNTIQGNGDTSIGGDNIQVDDVVTVLRYYNKADDKYIVLLNNVWVNSINGEIMPITYAHKEIPLVCYTDHYVFDNGYGLGEYDITERSRMLKDKARSMVLEVVRAQAGIITVDPDADFDESLMSFGFRDFARVKRDDISFFAPSINASTLQYIENKVDEDIIIESGVDFRNQILGPGETATRTQGRINAASRRINQNIKYNAYTFYERLARLRLANVQAYFKNKKRDVSTYAKDYEGSSENALNGGYGLFTIPTEYRKAKFNLIPIIDSLVGDATADKKQKFIEYIQLFSNMVDPATGKPIINPKKWIEASRGIMDDVVDLDILLGEDAATKSPEDLLAEADAGGELPPEQQPGYLPPEQRSGAPVLLGSSPNQPQMPTM